MLYYGYRFNREDVPAGAFSDIEDHEMLISCYSVSSYEPSECGFGVEIGNFGTIFYSVSLNDVIAAANKLDRDIASDVHAKFNDLPVSIRNVMKGPDFFLLENSDD